MENADYIQLLTERLDAIERQARFAGKEVLNFAECLAYTGLSRHKLYQLTQNREIPFSKCCTKLYFSKKKIDEWLLKDSYKTREEIDREAASYVFSNPSKK